MRRRLAVLVGATTSLVLIAFLIPLALLVRTVAADRAVTAGLAEAHNVVPLAANLDQSELAAYLEARADGPGGEYPLTVYLADGTTLGTPAPESPAVRLARAEPRSITTEIADGLEIIVSVQGAAHLGDDVVIRTVVTEAQLRDGVLRAWGILFLLGLVLLLVSMVVADRLGHSLVRSINSLSEVARRLGTGELTARAEPAGPRELRSVATALNTLATRIRALLAAERESVADLSHRVRTPLTVLQLDAESLRDPDEAARMSQNVDSMRRAVDQVIHDARRVDREGESCDATAVTGERLAFWSALAEEEGRAVTDELPNHPVPVKVSAGDLAACLDALLGNVFAHTPEGTAFRVRLRPLPDGGAELTVADRGPGIPDIDRVIRRGTSGAGSTGLGLDIARRTAERSGGRLTVANEPGGGAAVTLALGAPEN